MGLLDSILGNMMGAGGTSMHGRGGSTSPIVQALMALLAAHAAEITALQLLDQWRVGGARADDVEADVIPRVLASQRPRKGDDRRLCPGIDRFSHAADAASVG